MSTAKQKRVNQVQVSLTDDELAQLDDYRVTQRPIPGKAQLLRDLAFQRLAQIKKDP